jgi:steroid 5-alpha reductase family enzyme
MNLWQGYLTSLSVSVSLMSAVWLISVIRRDASLVDRFWGLGFVAIGWTLAALQVSLSLHQITLLSVLTIWGLRLSIYIHVRNRGKPEDYRYQAMRAKAPDHFWWQSWLRVFMLQAAIQLIVACPVIFVLTRDSSAVFFPLTLLAGVIWLIGFIFEAGGDWQLSQFKKNPKNKGQLMMTGLWSLSRHPNYFGDALQWWAFGLFALCFGFSAVPTLIGPMVMTFFIRKISGVDLLEKDMQKKHPSFADYAARVPAFVPFYQCRNK